MDIDSKEFIKLHKNATITIPKAIFTSCDRYCYAVIDLFLEKNRYSLCSITLKDTKSKI